jgi:hypothetical protein
VGPKGEKAILILSNVGPLRTTIILFDDPLHGQLVYDSYGTSGGGGVYYLCGVEVEDQNHFLLHEGVWPPSQGQELVVPRTLRLTVNDRMEVELGE